MPPQPIALHAGHAEPMEARHDGGGGIADGMARLLQEILHHTGSEAARVPSLVRSEYTHTLALDCAAALQLLEAAMAADQTQLRRLESELHDARRSLSRAHRDFADSHAGELQARHLALHDDLTALPNRRHCHDRIEEALRLADGRQATAALMFLDLDKFKVINDEHGHDAGDEVLRIVAARLARTVRAGDMVCRLGGDEFVCLPSGHLESAQLDQLARKLFDAVAAPLTIGVLTLQVSPSIGVAVFPTDAHTSEALLRAADAAMYRAKRHHTGVVFASPPAGLA
ncbi:diguanylate cyclase domain-containing protein [Ideonella sp.]|uniref:diguanylate cyclase domain-containing protein n=1 Tax=Ideonella sp. TaxID=1929293 RepID=UPI0035AEA222